MTKNAIDAIIPKTGAAINVVPKNSVGITFVSAGVPGRAVIVKVAEPATTIAIVMCLGKFASLKSVNIIGAIAYTTTNRLTPPYVNTKVITKHTSSTFSLPNQSIN